MTPRYARPAVLDEIDLGRHTVIEASAGTGKTFVLEHIVVEMLLRAEAPLESILVVTFTEKATREMRERIRRKLAAMVAHAEDDPAVNPPEGPTWLLDEPAVARLRAALFAFDRAPISTIHAFCQRILVEHAFDGKRLFEQEQVSVEEGFEQAVRRELRRAIAQGGRLAEAIETLLASDSEARLVERLFQWFRERGEPALAPGVRALLGGVAAPDPGVTLLDALKSEPPPPSKRRGSKSKEADPADLKRMADFATLVTELVPRVRARLARDKERRGLFDFDDMLEVLRERLHGPSGEHLAEELRGRFRFALVDEFQDTDDAQWAIFRRVFFESGGRRTLFVIGDPKQAIYSFRNADRHTYDTAKRAILAGNGKLVTLRDNYRSTRALVETYNGIAARMLHAEGEAYEPVNAAAEAERLVDAQGREHPPVVLMHAVSGDDASFSATSARGPLASFVAEEIARLVRSGSQLVSDTGKRPLTYGDIYVLTRTTPEGREVGDALRRAGVPHAFFRLDGLLQTDEAAHVLAVLRAVERPDDPSRRNRAWLTPFFDVPLASLVELSDAGPGHPLVDCLYRWRALGERGAYAQLFDAILDDTGVVRRALLLSPSERAVTNYEHVFELLLAHAHTRRAVLAELTAALSAWIDQRALPAGTDPNVMRLESDRNAVQVLTMHVSKGLEAPVVFLLGGLAQRPHNPEEPRVFHRDGRRLAWLGSDSPEEVKSEKNQEDTRLLYVAITRAKSKLYLPYFGQPTKSSAPVDRYKAQRLGGPYKFLNGALEPVAETLSRVEVPVRGRRSGGTLHAATACPDVALDPAWLAPLPDDAPRYLALRRERRGLEVTSYTRLARRRERLVAAESLVESFDVAPTDLAVRAGASATAASTEAVMLRGETPEAGATLAEPSAPPGAVLPSSAATGVFLHELLEVVSFDEVKAAETLEAWCESPTARALFQQLALPHGIDAQYERTALALVYHTLRAKVRLGERSLDGGLAEVARRAAEMPLLYPVPGREERALVRAVVDLVFELDGRVCFLDWKSDRLVGYGPGELEAHVALHYALQAKLYTLGVVRLLGVRDEAQYEARFGGLLYCFLRGMSAGSEGGTYFERPPWSAVAAWERELRGSEAPFGYPLFDDVGATAVTTEGASR